MYTLSALSTCGAPESQSESCGDREGSEIVIPAHRNYRIALEAHNFRGYTLHPLKFCSPKNITTNAEFLVANTYSLVCELCYDCCPSYSGGAASAPPAKCNSDTPVRRCTSSHRNLQLCKIPSCELVWLVSYASLIKEGEGEGEEEEEEDDEQCGKLHRLI